MYDRMRILSALLVVLLVVASLTLDVPLLHAQAPVCDQTYVVAQGDHLSKIAEKFYGDRSLWRLIFDATNAAALSDSSFSPIANPSIVVAGQKLCIPKSPTSAPSGAPSATGGDLTLEALKNATYIGIYDQPIKLTNGLYEGPPFEADSPMRPRVTFVDRLVVYGDLNGDGVADAAVLLVENSGGSGVFLYVAAVLNQAGQPVNVATQGVGDRVQIKSMVISQDQLMLEIVTQTPDDPFCCPTLKLRQTFQLQGDNLVETARQEWGKVSFKDLVGTSWLLAETDFDKPVLPGSQVTASFTADQLSGSAGCNTYSATITPGELQGLTISNASATMMACADQAMMDQEMQFLKALTGVTGWMYVAGHLGLNYQAGDTFGTLIFAPSRTG